MTKVSGLLIVCFGIDTGSGNAKMIIVIIQEHPCIWRRQFPLRFITSAVIDIISMINAFVHPSCSGRISLDFLRVVMILFCIFVVILNQVGQVWRTVGRSVPSILIIHVIIFVRITAFGTFVEYISLLTVSGSLYKFLGKNMITISVIIFANETALQCFDIVPSTVRIQFSVIFCHHIVIRLVGFPFGIRNLSAVNIFPYAFFFQIRDT